jgi:hypothetical protein
MTGGCAENLQMVKTVLLMVPGTETCTLYVSKVLYVIFETDEICSALSSDDLWLV